MRTVSLRGFAVALAVLAIGACGREQAPAAAPAPAMTEQQAIDAATARERAYQEALAKGDLGFLADCTLDGPESVRLVDMADDDSQGYSLAVTTDPHGAVAIWQGIQRLPTGAYQAYGARGMRLDGNAWRQLRQALVDPGFAVQAQPDSVAPGAAGGGAHRGTFVVYCLAGERRSVQDPGGMAGVNAFERTAVTMRRLAGNHYSPPGAGGQ